MSALEKFKEIKALIQAQALLQDKCPINKIRQMSEEGSSICHEATLELNENITGIESKINKDLQSFLENPEQVEQHKASIEADMQYRLIALEKQVFLIASKLESKDNTIEEITALLTNEKELFTALLNEIGRGEKKISPEEQKVYLEKYANGIKTIEDAYSDLQMNASNSNLKIKTSESFDKQEEEALKDVEKKKLDYSESERKFIKNHSDYKKLEDLKREKLDVDKIAKELDTDKTKKLLLQKMSELASQEKYIQAIEEKIDNFESHAMILRLNSNAGSKHEIAANTIESISSELRNDLDDIKNTSLSMMQRKTKISTFRETVIEKINTGLGALNQHRDLKGVLLDLVNLVNSLYKLVTGSRFSFFSTQSESLLQKTAKKIAKTADQETSPRPK